MKKLFEPFRIRCIEVKNRIVMPAMGTHCADENGQVTDRLIKHYEKRAKGGVGLIIVEASYVDPVGKGFRNQIGISEDKFIPGLQDLVKAVTKHGTKVAVQLHHAGRSSKSQTIGTQPVAPSSISSHSGQMPRELAEEEIEILIDRFGDGARRAAEVGFDAVEIHGAHGYLINQFLSPLSNKRSDIYGGSFENRLRFAVEIVKNIREKTANDFPILFKLVGNEFLRGGLTFDNCKETAKHLEKAGVDIFDVSIGPGPILEIPPKDRPIYSTGTSFDKPGFMIWLTDGVKQVVNTPVIAVNKVWGLEFADNLLVEGKADLVAMGRPLLADPDLPRKGFENRLDEITPCIACCRCLKDAHEDKKVTCTVNPFLGKEDELVEPAEKTKKILVAGGGPAGMEAAKIAALRGHEVILYEEQGEMGGQLLYATKPPYREELLNFLIYLKDQLLKFNVEVKTKSKVTAQVIDNLSPDVIVLATGAKPLIPKILGVERENVVMSLDVLGGKKEVGKNVTIVGGGLVGAETADYLAHRNREVIIVEQLSEIAADEMPQPRACLLSDLQIHGVKMLTNAKVEEIEETYLTTRRYGNREKIYGDSVVLATGARPNNELAEKLKNKGLKIHSIGDCVKPRKLYDAIQEGFGIMVRT